MMAGLLTGCGIVAALVLLGYVFRIDRKGGDHAI